MDDAPHPVQVEGFRRMTPAQKLRMVADLYEAGIQLRIAGLRMSHPDWSAQRLDREARRSLLHAGT
jgi:3-deoxy-D-manno-octulosonic acid (KDO) 8-phosphate synthase